MSNSWQNVVFIVDVLMFLFYDMQLCCVYAIVSLFMLKLKKKKVLFVYSI